MLASKDLHDDLLCIECIQDYHYVVGYCLSTNHVKGVVGGKKEVPVVESPGSKLLLEGGCGLRVLATHSAAAMVHRVTQLYRQRFQHGRARRGVLRP